MKTKWVVVCLLLVITVSAFAQTVARPYHNGSVWNVALIHVKPGMESAYLNYLTTDWKREQEALKQEGMILSYKVISAESHGATDWNVMLMTEYKDLATMEANGPKADALVQRVLGSDDKVRQGYRERSEIRDVLGERVAREIILEPRKP
jgi:hypothetical protein